MVIEKDAYTLPEFCERHSLSRGGYYNLKNAGKGPKEIRLGHKVIISREAAEQWRRDREADAA